MVSEEYITEDPGIVRNTTIASNQIINALSLDIKGERAAKLLLFFFSLGNYFGENCIIILTGSLAVERTNLINAISDLHPSDYIHMNYAGGTGCERFLARKHWDEEKILVLKEFHQNKKLLLKFIKGDWRFSLLSRHKGEEFTEEIEIPQMSVFTSASKDDIDDEIAQNSLIIDLYTSSELTRKRSRYNAYLSGNYNRVLKREKSKETYLLNIQEFLESLDKSVKIEVPFENVITQYFEYGVERNTVYHRLFLLLIKCITFFHQDKRDYYVIKENKQKVILSCFGDLKLAFEIGKEAFTRISQNLRAKYLLMLDFIKHWIRREKLLWFTRGKLISDYKDYLRTQHSDLKSTRTYESYIDFLVKEKCLYHKKEKNINWYKLKNIPSLKEPDLVEDEVEINRLMNHHFKSLKEDNSIMFSKIKYDKSMVNSIEK